MKVHSLAALPLRPCISKGAMAMFVAVLVACAPATSQETGQQCDVGGRTAMWAMSFCMSIHSTDDEAHPDVMNCYLLELDALRDAGVEEDCTLNLAYKSAICRTAVELGRFEGGLMACVNSNATIPGIVAAGGI